MSDYQAPPGGGAAAGAAATGADSRQVLDGFECRFAYRLPEADVLGLLAVLDRPRDAFETTAVLG
ncbi:MAG: hypothetical protein Q7V01_09090, partial [Vicinamibacterales bacterium]|nr:hypothetical protein [Vicinamibacterales bacterium]